MAKNKQFAPLGLQLVDEGRFLEQADADLMDCQQVLLEFLKRHGEKSKGAKCKLTIDVTLCCDNPDDEVFSIKAITKKSFPARPASVTLAMSAEMDSGKPALFVRRSGSSEMVPAQGKLTTTDGRIIDQATGGVAQ